MVQVADSFSSFPSNEKKPRPQHSTSNARRLGAFIGSVFLYMSVVVLLFIGFMLVGTNLVNASSQTRLIKQFQNEKISNPYIAPSNGEVLGEIYIPKISLNRAIVQGTSENDLIMGPGHYTGTPLPGQVGNVAIAGHRTTYGAPFYNIGKLLPGDVINVSTKAGSFVYKVVRSLVVAPSDNSVLASSKAAVLTLTTCNPLFSASTRLIVVAQLVGSPIGSSSASNALLERTTTLRTTRTVFGSNLSLAIGVGILALLTGLIGLYFLHRAQRSKKVLGISVLLLSLVGWIFTFIFGASLLPGSF